MNLFSDEAKGHSMVVVGVPAIYVPLRDRVYKSKSVSFIETPRPFVVGLDSQFDFSEPRPPRSLKDEFRQSTSDAAALATGKDENSKGSGASPRADEHIGEAAHTRFPVGDCTYQERGDRRCAQRSERYGMRGEPEEDPPRGSAERQRFRAQESRVEKPLAFLPETVVRTMNLTHISRQHRSDVPLLVRIDTVAPHRDASTKPRTIKRYGIVA